MIKSYYEGNKIMKLISHRGNINKRSINDENHPLYIEEAIIQQYDVEIDIWRKNSKLYLGHDEPQYNISLEWIIHFRERLWVHCKNIDALEYFSFKYNLINFFWHQEDDVTLTSLGYLWTYPGKQLTKYSIAVMPETKSFSNIEIAYGVCSDLIQDYLSIGILNENSNYRTRLGWQEDEE